MPEAVQQTRPRGRSSWRQTVSSMMGMGFGTSHATQRPHDEEEPTHDLESDIVPSQKTLTQLRDKAWRQKFEPIVAGLVESRRSYLNHVDENWQGFLDKLQIAYDFLEGQTPKRDYRDGFTIENYRMLFQRESCTYRDDVCRGVKRIRDGMWVNGEEVKFCEELVEEGNDLAGRGEQLMDSVFIIDEQNFHQTLTGSGDNKSVAVAIERFKKAVHSFEERYVTFEKNYIDALIAVEKQSRSLVQQLAQKITDLADSGELVNQNVLDKIAELNKKSRDCFNCKYDNGLMQNMIAKTYENTVHKRLWYLPQELLERYGDISKYLQDLLPKILRVHPKLEHNPGLVQRLEKFHDTYLRVVNWIVTDDQNAMSDFCQFLEDSLPDVDLGASVEACLMIPRAFCLFVWKHRERVATDPSYALSKLVHELQPELLVEIQTVLCAHKLEDAPFEDLVSLIMARGIDTADPSDVSKAWEAIAVHLQRANANRWNAFASVILHEEEDAEEKLSRPRLPSV